MDKVSYHIAWSCDQRLWDDFVRRHPHGQVFQLPDFYYAHLHAPRSSAIACFVFHGSDLVGLMVGVVIRSFLPFFSARTVVRGGPLLLTGHRQAMTLLLHSFNRKARSVSLFTQIRPLVPPSESERNALSSAGFVFEPHLNFLNDLRGGIDAVWQSVHRHRRRNIRKATRGLTVRKKGPEALREAYGILRHNYRRYRMPLLPFEVFERLQNSLSFKEDFLIFVVYKGEKPVGTLLAIGLNQTLYCWYACSLPGFYKFYPNDLLHWEVMRWAARNGYDWFDFGGAGSPSVPYGVREFKRQYGGSECNVGRWTHVYHPVCNAMARKAFDLLQRLMGWGNLFLKR
ncbi:MAG: GNAT family N-acetyltransferase [Paludibacteraceae bacterium]|nr:GNAT family N-acetyltransferase [Paludibacteraceae bacterium]